MAMSDDMFKGLDEEVYLPKDEYDRVMRLHSAYPIPAVKLGLVKLVCTDEIEVKEEEIVSFEEPEKKERKRKIISTPTPLWDAGDVVELTPDITKISVSVSELRNRIKNISAINNND